MLGGAELAPVGQDLLELLVLRRLLVEHGFQRDPQRLDHLVRQHRELRPGGNQAGDRHGVLGVVGLLLATGLRVWVVGREERQG